MRYGPIGCAVLALCLAGPGWTVARAAGAEPKVMNNFVTELVNAPVNAVHAEYLFTNPRDGWVFFSTTTEKPSPGALCLTLDGAPKEKAILNHQGKTTEAMRWLPAGPHKVETRSEAGMPATLVVRTMPEIIHNHWVGFPTSPDGGPFVRSSKERNGSDALYLYSWDWLHEYILPNANVICDAGEEGIGSPVMRQWIADGKEGKKLIITGRFYCDDLQGLYDKFQTYFREPYEGMFLDEFVPPKSGFTKEVMGAIRKVHDNPELKGKFYAYAGFPSGSKAEDFRMLMETLKDCGYLWVPEVYLWEEPTEAKAQESLNTLLRDRMLDFRKTYPGCEKSCVVCPAILDAWDSFAHVDMKVWLDMQFNMMANDPAFKDVYGVTLYSSTVADPEIMLWSSRLYRHYCIEGRTDMLSTAYGYSYILNYIENPGFLDGQKGWTIMPSQEGAVKVKTSALLPITKGYLPRSDKVLYMKRSDARPNLLRQEIRNLKPGRLYALWFYAADLASTAKQQYGVSVQVAGAELLADRSRNYAWVGDGSDANKACWNYFYRVFRATSEKAMLTISDWTDEKTPGGPAGQEMIYDSIKIEPLFEMTNPR